MPNIYDSKHDEDLIKSIDLATEKVRGSIFKTKQQVKDILTADKFEEFVFYFFSDSFKDMQPLPYFHKDAINNMFVHDKTMQIWEWFRGSGKSMLATIYIPVFLLLTNRFKGMMIISNEEGTARELMKPFVITLETNVKIHDYLGRKPKILGSLSKRRMSIDNEFGIWAFGMGQNPQGSRMMNNRPNYLVMDDTEKSGTSQQKESHVENRKFLMGTVLGCCSTPGSDPPYCIFANNRLKGIGLMTEMIEYNKKQADNPFHHSQVYLTEDPKTHKMLLIEEGGQPAWPEGYSLQACKGIFSRMGRGDALRQMYHQDVYDANFFDVENISYTPMHIKSKDATGNEVIKRWRFDKIIIYTDPAFSDSKHSDYSAVVVLGYDQSRQTMVLIDITISKDPFERLIYNIDLQTRKYLQNYYLDGYKPQFIRVIEAIGANENAINQRFDSFRNKVVDFVPPVIDKKAKHSKEDRIKTIPFYFQKSILRINEDIKKHSQESYRLLIEEMNQFPYGLHDDGLDALQGAMSEVDLYKVSDEKITFDIDKFSQKTPIYEDVNNVL